MYCAVNNKVMPVEEATISIRDLSILRGYGIFDFFRTDQGIPLFLDDHLARLSYSSNKVFPKASLDIKAVKDTVLRLMTYNNKPLSGIRIVRTGGVTPDGYEPGTPNLIITQEDISFPSDEKYKNGVKLISYEFQRELVEVKTISYMTGIWLQDRVHEAGAYDILYHQDKKVSELTRSNFFIVDNNETLITPAVNILKGVTRKKVIELAGKFMKVEEREITLREVSEAKETFLTGTTKRVLPVTQIDDSIIGNGKPGPKTKAIMEAFEKLENEYFDNNRKN
ncbi:aminotransferase class IV [Fulvivirga sediminis]|uniref:branched-chain-amino-acid transaminase n=1 Tax=Fulvivirga sediminis TaxID=2803949 RepID=A0A937K0M2_9BACT|nr:aminotransferase class IV [Fulvivirga sediminis]MBL3656440.1 aminotransferase class IV [Fulvivirga sediminis]